MLSATHHFEGELAVKAATDKVLWCLRPSHERKHELRCRHT